MHLFIASLKKVELILANDKKNSAPLIIEIDSFAGKEPPNFKWLIDEVRKETVNSTEFTIDSTIKTNFLKK